MVRTGRGPPRTVGKAFVRTAQEAHFVPSGVTAGMRAAIFLFDRTSFTNTYFAAKQVSNEGGLSSVKKVESFSVICEPEFEVWWHFEKGKMVVVTLCPPGHVEAGQSLYSPADMITPGHFYMTPT